jgi:hypothetical protein
VLGRTRRHDSNRIVRQTVHALEALTMAVELADPAGLDPAEVTGWAASMTPLDPPAQQVPPPGE